MVCARRRGWQLRASDNMRSVGPRASESTEGKEAEEGDVGDASPTCRGDARRCVAAFSRQRRSRPKDGILSGTLRWDWLTVSLALSFLAMVLGCSSRPSEENVDPAHSTSAGTAQTLGTTVSGIVEAGDEPTDPGSGYLWDEPFDRYASVVATTAPGDSPAGTPGFGLNGATTYDNRTMPNTYNLAQASDPDHQFKWDDGSPVYSFVTGRSGVGQAYRIKVPSTNGRQGGAMLLSPWSKGWTPPDTRQATVVQFWVRISSGGTPGSPGQKWLMMFWTGSPPEGRIQWGPWAGNQTTGPLFSAVLGSNPGGTINRASQPVGPYWNDINDDAWHRVTHLYLPNTRTTYRHTGGGTNSATETYSGTSSRDGRVAMWIDGKKIVDYSQATVGVTPPGGTGPWCYQSDVDFIPTYFNTTRIHFPGTHNNTHLVGYRMDYDDLKVWALTVPLPAPGPPAPPEATSTPVPGPR